LSTHRPAHSYSGQVLVSYIFSNSRPPKGIAGYVDWLLDGQISDLILNEKVKGAFCESLLMVTGSKIKAHFLLIIGAGNPKKLAPGMIREIGRYTIGVLDGLKVSHFGLYPHELFLPHLDSHDILDELLSGLKSSRREGVQCTILSSNQNQENTIITWLTDKAYILKPA
jgi:hypothetical protein